MGLIGQQSSLLVAFLVVSGLIAASLAASGASRPLVAPPAHEDLAVGAGTEML